MSVGSERVNALVVLATFFATIALITPGWVAGYVKDGFSFDWATGPYGKHSTITVPEVPLYLGFSFGDQASSYAVSALTTFVVIFGSCYAAASHTNSHVHVYGSLGTELLVPFLMSVLLLAVVIIWPITIGAVLSSPFNDAVKIQPGYSYILAVFSMLFCFLAVGLHVKQNRSELSRPAARSRSRSPRRAPRARSISPQPTRTTRREAKQEATIEARFESRHNDRTEDAVSEAGTEEV